MLKRGSRTGGTSRRNRPTDSWSERYSSPGSRSSSPRPTRRKTRRSSTRDNTSVQDSSDEKKKERLKKGGRMKRAPLLDYSIVEAVYSAMAGQAQRRASRHWLEQFTKYEEAKRPGMIKADKFTRCLNKMGIELDRREHYEILSDCFKTSGGAGDDSDSGDNNKERTTQLVDYAAFVDFTCNVRDSEKLSEIAESLRESISKYDGKKQSSTSYNLAAGLEKLDRHKRGWITSTQLEQALQRQDQGPSFRLSAAQMNTLVDRFEYEYEKQQLGIDYMQFVQWLQPLLHLDVKKVHERVKLLIEDAGSKQGWKLDEVFRSMDDDKDGEIDAVELKEALLEMGLPLTDAQIRCLADEYDVDGDGKIQYNEFLSLFASSGKKRAEIKKKKGGDQSDTGSTTDLTKTRRNRPKRNVRNSFSWGITKAFARKQAAKSDSRKSSTDNRRAKDKASASSEEGSSEAATKRKPPRLRKERDDTSSEEEIAEKRTMAKKRRSRNQLSDFSNEDKHVSSSASDNQRKQSSKSKSRRDIASKRAARLSSTETEQEDSGREQRKKRDSRTNRKMKIKTITARSDEEGKARESSISDAPKRSSKKQSGTKSPEKRLRETPKRGRSRRSASRSGPRSRSRQKVSRRQSSRRRATLSPRRRRNVSRSRSVRMRRATRNISASNSDDGINSGFSDNNDSSSGLDVEQLRRLQQTRAPRTIRRRRNYATSTYGDKTDEEPDENVWDGSENSENEDDGEEWSRSDEEYHKHLKRSLRRAFDFFDLDQTSTIDKRELSHVLRALGHEFTSKELEAEMASADLDRNGQLDFYEFVAFVKKQLAQKTYLLSQQREMEIRQSFQSLDTDKNGALDEQEFEYLIYKVLQVELSIEEQAALLDFVDKDADGLISEEEFIAFMKELETLHRKYSGKGGWRKQKQFIDSLDGISQLAYSAMKKLVRGAPMDIDRSLLMFFGIPSNFRPAISSAATCRTLLGNTMEHVLSFPSPQTIEALALDTRVSDKKSWFTLNRLDTNSEEYRMLQIAEGVEAQAIVSLKRAAGVPKPFDTREDDVVKRCVHVCLFQEKEMSATAGRRRAAKAKAKGEKVMRAGTVVGNVHEIPVYWHQGEEDVWEFSKKSTKQDKYKFLVRTNAVNDHLYLLVEFIVHLKLSPEEHQAKKQRSKRRIPTQDRDESGDETSLDGETREMVCCWCKIPVRQLLAKRSGILRRKEKLWGGTANAPVDIEQDELLRRRTGWRAFTNMFTKPSPPLMGIKSVPIDSLSEDLQRFVRKMPPIVIAPFVSLPILAEYMTLVRKTLACVASSSSVMTCEPALKLLPKIVDDHVALSIFRKAFDSEVAGMKPGEERQLKFQQLVLRMWPSFVHWQERLPPSLLPPVKLPGLAPNSKAPASIPPKGVSAATSTADEDDPQVAAHMRLNLLQTTASGKLRLQDVRVTSTPFHVREVAFRRLL